MSNMNIPPNPKVANSLMTANKHWNSLLNQIKKANNEPRITILLANIMIEYYMNEILITRKKLKSHKQKIKYGDKVKLLSSEPEITSRVSKNILRFYELRNTYAHQMEVDWTWVTGKIDVLCKQFPVIIFSTIPKQRYNRVLPMVVQELAGKFMAIMAREEQSHHMRIAKMRAKAKKKTP